MNYLSGGCATLTETRSRHRDRPAHRGESVCQLVLSGILPAPDVEQAASLLLQLGMRKGQWPSRGTDRGTRSPTAGGLKSIPRTGKGPGWQKPLITGGVGLGGVQGPWDTAHTWSLPPAAHTEPLPWQFPVDRSAFGSKGASLPKRPGRGQTLATFSPAPPSEWVLKPRYKPATVGAPGAPAGCRSHKGGAPRKAWELPVSSPGHLCHRPSPSCTP